MSSINKLKNIWVSNDSTNLQGTYSKVSILNEGKTELKGDTLINTKLAINKNVDSTNDYKLDVGGNINFTGNLYQNNALFQSGITLQQVQSNQNNFTNNFTVDNTSTAGSNITFNSRAIIFNTPNTDDFSNGLQIKDASGRVYFSTFPQDLNTAIINPNSVTGYMYINQNTVFQGGITLQTNGGVGGTLQVGTGYGVGTIYVNNGTIEVDSSSANNKLKVNVIDAYNPSTVSSIYPAITNTINIGNSLNTYNVNMYGIWNVLGSIKSNNLTITPAQLGYLSGATSSIQTQLNSKLGTTITQNLTANSLTITPVQLGYLNGLTSDIQSQLNSKLGTTITQNLTANSLTITPVQLGYLNGLTSDIQSQLNSKLGTTITQTLTANSLTITPTQLGYLNGTTSNIQTQLDSKLGTTITQNITANSLTITPEQLSFLNRVLKTPSANATLIPKTAISNYTDFLQYNVNTTITGTYTFSTNPGFNNYAISSMCIDNLNVPRFVETDTDSTVYATITFITNPVFNNDAIPTSAINGISNYLLSATASTTYVPNSGNSTINDIKTFASPPVMSGASITSNTIPTSAINGISNYLLSATASTTYVPNSGNSTINGIKTFNSPPVMSGASITSNTIPSTAISYTTYIPNSVSTLTPSTDITLTSPLNNYYTFTSASTATTITLPTITNAILGCPLTFRRVGNTTSALNIKTPASSNTTIVQRASISETAQNTSYTFLSTTQFIGTVMAISLTKWSVVA
jgi:rRNA processing protein Krr1/Pno1